MAVNTWNEPLNTWNAASSAPVINGAFNLPVLSVAGIVTVIVPQPIINGNITLPALRVQGFATVSGLRIIVDPLTNINQQYLSNNINYK